MENCCRAILEASSSEPSSEDSVDEGRPENEQVEAAVDRVVGPWSGRVQRPIPEAAVFFRHCSSRRLHLVMQENATSFVCGRALGQHFQELESRPMVLDARCKQCFRGFVV